MKKITLLFVFLCITFNGLAQSPCSPLSTLDCSAVGVSLPVAFNFNAAAGGISDTGFTMVDPPSARLASDIAVAHPNVPGLIAGNLNVSGGLLNVTATNGINFSQPAGIPNSTLTNSQMNALGVGITASTNIINIAARINQPNFAASTNAGANGAQQGGIWYGINENNFVKLVLVKSSATQQKVQLNLEQTDPSNPSNLIITEINTFDFNIISGSTIDLRISFNPVSKIVEGYYSINNAPEIKVVQGAATSLTAPATFVSGINHDNNSASPSLSFGGIMTSSRRATGGSLIISFDSFSITEGPYGGFSFIEDFNSYGTGNLGVISGGAWIPEAGNPQIPLINDNLTPLVSQVLDFNNLATVFDYQTLINNPVSLIPNVPFYFGTYFKVEELGPIEGDRIRVVVRVDDDTPGDQWIRERIGFYDGAFAARVGLGDPASNNGQATVYPGQVLQFVVRGVWNGTNNISYSYTINPGNSENTTPWTAIPTAHSTTGVPKLGRIFISSTSTENKGKLGPIRLSTDYAAVVTELIDSNPYANFSSSIADLQVNLDASSSMDDDSIVSYTWDFGNGETGTGAIINYTYPTAGTYSVTLTVLDNTGNSGSVVKDVIVSASTLAPFPYLVNFQDEATIPPAGYAKDYGLAYGPKAEGLTYGWIRLSDGTPIDLSLPSPGSGRNRNHPGVADLRLNTLVHMQGNDVAGWTGNRATEGVWEILVPNGWYEVSVSVGDANQDGTISETPDHFIRVEGKTAIDVYDVDSNLPAGDPGRFTSGTVLVQVTDGKLTIDANNTLAQNTKINFATIAEAEAPVNQSPTATAQSFQIGSNAIIGAVVGTILATDPEEDALTFAITSGNETDTFTIDPLSGVIATLEALDFESDPSYLLTVEISDGINTITIPVTIEVNEVVSGAPCSPISTLPCDQIVKSLPVNFTFSGQESGMVSSSGLGIGFTMVDAHSNTRLPEDAPVTFNQVTGYEPSKLDIVNNNLVITASKGIAFINNNAQVNSLGVGIKDVTAPIVIETKLLGINTGGNSAQAGIWYGIDDKNFVKLNVNSTFIEIRREILDVSDVTATTIDQIQVDAAAVGQDVSLRLVIDPVEGTMKGFYAIGNGPYVQLTKIGLDALALPQSYVNGRSIDSEMNGVSFAGVYATYRNGVPFNATYDYFSITEEPVSLALNFNTNRLDFIGGQGTAIAPKTVTLSATSGTPTFVLSPDPDAGSWLVLPGTPVLGEIQIGVAENLPLGSYSTTLYAIDQPDLGYTNGELLVTLEVTDPANDFAANINFSDAVTPAPNGYIRDSGLGYGNRGNGLNFGWLTTNGATPLNLSANARNRNMAGIDVLQNTLIHMQYANANGTNGVQTEGIWEIEVPNGVYNVTVGVGDPELDGVAGTTPSHTINVEGINLVNNYVPTGVAGSATRFTSGFGVVVVNDGRLTVNASGGFNTKINSIRIIATTGSNQTPSVVSVSPANGATNVSVNANISANNLFLPNFNELGNSGVDNASISNATVQLYKQGNLTPLAATVNGTGGGDAINLDPTLPLEPSTTYRFVINGVLDNTGVPFQNFESTFTTGTSGGGGPSTNLDNVSFSNAGVVANGAQYTTLTIGPDDKLYGLVINGDIHRWTIAEDGTLSNREQLNSWKSPSQGNYSNRTSVGFVFDPNATATNLIAYITHNSGGLDGAPAWDGNLSRLSGPNLENHRLILTQLPRSKKDHLTNSMAFKPGEPRVIYFNQGSNSAAGAPDNAWGNRKERLLSAATLRLDLDKLPENQWPLNVKTTMDPVAINAVNVNSPTLTSTVNTYTEDGQTFTDNGTYNPFYINAPLTLFATGIRNAYDLVWHSNGQLYIPTNGTAGGSNAPASINGTRRPDGTFYNHSDPLYPIIPATNNNNVQKDWLFRVDPAAGLGYYGHPNPLLGQFVLNRGDADVNNAVYNGVQADVNYRGAAYDFNLNISPNGVIEYRSNAENGNLQGALLVVRYSGGSDIIALVPDGPNGDILTAKTGIPGFSGFVDPLDLIEDVTNGNIYVSDFARNEIVLLKPSNQASPMPLIALNKQEIKGDAISNSNTYTDEIIISNLGNAVLSSITTTITGANSNQFAVTGVPSTIGTQTSASFNVLFTPTSPGPKFAQLTISGTDVEPVIIQLSGLGKSGLGGANEPSLQWVLDTQLGSGVVNVGDTNPNTNIIDLPNGSSFNDLIGDEIAAQKFERATDAPVTLELLSVYGPTTSNPVVALGWYDSGNAASTHELFIVTNSPATNGQSLNAPIIGATQFDPGLEAFGFYSRWPFFGNRQLYSEDALNTFTGAIPHHVRVYELPGEENAYIIATEEHIDGFDYQDIVFIARNIKPFGGLPNIVSNPSELIFEITTNGQGPTTDTKTITLSNDGQEILNITNASISGTYAGQFNEVVPAGPVSILPGEQLTYTITYAPDLNGSNLGYQNAALLIESDAANAPNLTIGLFGLKKSGFEGGNEPPLQAVVNTLGIGINVGWTSLANGTSPNPLGQEVEVERWIKASEGPINIIPVGRYSPAESLPFGWYTNDGQIVTYEVGVLASDLPNAQTLYPEVASGTTVFDPQGAVFGIFVESNEFERFNYTEDAINTGGVAHRTRIYPMADRQGNPIANSYLVTFEDASNGDYQDYMFVIDNVLPYEDGILALSFDKEELSFVASLNQTDLPKQSISISRTGGVTAQEITLTSTQEWVVLPETFTLNTPFDIGLDIAGLEQGSYQATVSATALNYEATSVLINLVVTNELVYTYQFNFQTPTNIIPSPEGYIDDIGAGYGVKNTSIGDISYGWVLPGTLTPANAGANARNRNNGVNNNALLKTFTIIGHRSAAEYPRYDWLVNVPNGIYAVNISVGDPNFLDSNHVLDVNGVTVVNYNQETAVPQSFANFEDTKFAEVTNGILRLSLGTGGVNAKPNYIRLAPVNSDLIPPTLMATFDGYTSAADTYRGAVAITLEATDRSESGGIARLEYILDNAAVQNYTTPIQVSGVGNHSLVVTAEDNNGNLTERTFTFTIEPASGALLAIENMTKVPGTNRGFPAEDYFTFYRLGTRAPNNAQYHDANVMRIRNTGTSDLIVSNIVISDVNDYTYSILPNGTGSNVLPLVIPPNTNRELNLTFIGTTGTGSNGIFKESIQIVSNADNALQNTATLHGGYAPQAEGGDEINAQEVFDVFGFKTSMLSIVNDQGTITPPNGAPANPSSNYPKPENIEAGYEGDLVLSSNWVQADATKPVIGIQLSALHGFNNNGAEFIEVNSSNRVGGILFNHATPYYQSLLPKNTNGDISYDVANVIDRPFRIRIALSYTTQGGNTVNGDNPNLLGVRVYKVIDRNGVVVPNEYIAIQDFIENGCGAGTANCDWNDNTFYFINIRPQAVPSALGIADYFVNTGESFSLDLASYFNQGYPGNKLSISATMNGGALPSWLQFNPNTRVLSGTPPSNASGAFNLQFTAVDLNGLTASTALALIVNAPPTAQDDTAVTFQNLPLLLDNLLDNDTDPNGQALSILTVDTPQHGQATVQANGTSVLYTPNLNYVGTDSFTYIVQDATGLTASATVTITVNAQNQAPTANIVTNIDQGPAALVVQFSGSTSTDESPQTLGYQWNFGDGVGTSSNANTEYTFTSAGVYTVTLTVTDAQGLLNVATKTITVTGGGSNTPPTAVASVTPVNGGQTLLYYFDATASTDAQGAITYLWDFGDGTTSTTVSTTHLYAAAGIYNVVLTVTDSQGLTDTDTATLTATQPPVASCPNSLPNEHPAIVLPSGSFIAGLDTALGTSTNTNGSPCALELTNTDAGQPWSRYRIPIVLSQYGISAGDVLLVGIDGRSVSGPARMELTVNNTPNTALTFSNFGSSWSRYQTTVTVPSGATTLDLWLFSNYGSSTGGTAAYDNLTIINQSASTGNQAPVANAGSDISVVDTDGNGSQMVSLNGSGSFDSDGSIVSYVWRENSVEIATGPQPNVVFAVGVHTVTLTVTDNQGLTATDAVMVTVTQPTAAAPPVANAGSDITVVDTDGNGSQMVSLNGSGSFDSDGSIVSYVWRENSVEIATGPQPNVVFTVGVHTVILTVTDSQGLTATDTVVITVTQAPVANCPNSLPNEHPAIVLPSGSFIAGLDTALGTSTNTNGSPCALELTNTDAGQPWSRYRIPIVLSQYGISAGDVLLVGIDGRSVSGPARMELTVNNTANTAIAFSNFGSSWSRYQTTVTVPSGATTLDLWLFSNYGSSTGGTAAYDYLTIINQSASTGNQAPVANAGSDISVVDTDGNGSQMVSLNGSGSFDSDGSIVSYIWRENSVEIAIGVQPSIAFAVGVHTVILTVTDNQGLTATDTVLVTVTQPTTAVPPVANAGSDITVVDTDGNGSQTASLNGSGSFDSDGSIVSYVWRENSVQIATGAQPSVTFTVGVHTVVLTVTDNQGLTATDTVVVTVTQGPVASCPNSLPNEHPAIVLPSGSFIVGLDTAVGTSTNTNGSPCALELTNTDAGQPWSRYRIPIVLSQYGISAGDVLLVGIDGRSVSGPARMELTVNNTANTAIAFSNFGSSWSRYQTTITVPAGATTLDLWLFSNYGSSTGGTAAYDNLTVINQSVAVQSLMAKEEQTVTPVNTLSLYPNPASFETSVRFEMETEVEQIEVYDVTGRLVRTIQGGRINQTGMTMDVEYLPVGTYFLKVRDSQGQQFQKQMIVRR